MRQKRKQYSGQEKIMILRKHLLEGVAVSDVCEEYSLQPSLFYRWQKSLFEQGHEVFEGGQDRSSQQQQREIVVLKEKLRKKDEVLAEVMEEYITLKKSSGAV